MVETSDELSLDDFRRSSVVISKGLGYLLSRIEDSVFSSLDLLIFRTLSLEKCYYLRKKDASPVLDIT